MVVTFFQVLGGEVREKRNRQVCEERMTQPVSLRSLGDPLAPPTRQLPASIYGPWGGVFALRSPAA